MNEWMSMMISNDQVHKIFAEEKCKEEAPTCRDRDWGHRSRWEDGRGRGNWEENTMRQI